MTAESSDTEVEITDETVAGDDAADSQPDAGQAEESELERLRRESEENRDNYLRLAAELDNLRKRSAREIENARKFGIERFAQALLPVYDSIEASLAIEQTDVASMLEGQKATLRLLSDAFDSAGVEQIDPHGHPFDPAKHEAMSMLPSPHADPHTVLDVIQKGYAIQERLLRPARVVVVQPQDDDKAD